MKGASWRTLRWVAGAAVLVAFAAAAWSAAAPGGFWAEHDGVVTGGVAGLALAAAAGAIAAGPRRLPARLALAGATYVVHALALARLAGWHAADPTLARALLVDGLAFALVVAAGQRWSPRWLATSACALLVGWCLFEVLTNAFAPYGTGLVEHEAVDGLVVALGAVGRHLATVWDAPAAPVLPRAIRVRPCGPRSGAARA